MIPNYFSSHQSIKPYVDVAISTFEAGNIPLLQQKLYELYSLLNKPGSGRLITGYPQKDRLSECFCMCLEYDWMNDSDIREVWAEDGFYCIVEYLKTANTRQDYVAFALDLFLICTYGGRDLRTKFNDVLRKANFHPFDSSRFTDKEYMGGADYLVREFKFFCATILSPVVKQYPQIISERLRGEYDRAKTDFEFATIGPDDIMQKMYFLSAIIGSILDDM